MGLTSRRLSSTMGLTRRCSEGTPAAPCLSFASLTLSRQSLALGRRFCGHTSRARLLTWHMALRQQPGCSACKPLILKMMS